jgi:hypothetical protein
LIPRPLFSIPIIFSILLISFSGKAQSPFEVSGIFQDTEPLAIINGSVYKAGQTVDGFRIKKIRNDAVVFIDLEGKKIKVEVGAAAHQNNESEVPTGADQGGKHPDYLNILPAKKQPSARRRQDANEHIQKAYDYYNNGNIILSRSRIKSSELYRKAISDITKAEREMQYAKTKTEEDYTRESVKNHLKAFRETKSELYKKKRVLEKKIKSAIMRNSLMSGMTKNEVRRSVGNLYECTTERIRTEVYEKCSYNKKDGLTGKASFTHGILVSYY